MKLLNLFDHMKTIPKIVIVKTIEEDEYADFIIKEISLQGGNAVTTNIKNLKTYLNKNNCSPSKTIIHSRTAHPDYTYKVLKGLEDEGYKVINSAESIKLTSDKYNSCIFAKQQNLPCAQTVKISKQEAKSFIKEKIKDWNEVIVKPITSQGQGEFAFKFDQNNIDQINQIKAIKDSQLIVQEFINYQRLNRVIVINGRALEGAVFWDEPKDSWKCSVCLNPKVKVYQNPPKQLLELAETIADKFKAEISFIDIFTTAKGYVLNEINTACNLVINEKVSKYSISKDIANYLLNCAKKI
tara:strand:+ start:1178 stop:2071 length:894 start_codon:yes stop_codon:yes gene_type:complete